MEREAGVLPRHRPPPLGAARGSEACVGTHAALCRCSGGEAGEGSRGSQAGDATLPAGARRAVLPCAPQSWPRARIPPSASRPPSSSPLGSQPRSTSLIFSKLPLPRALCAPGAWLGAQEGSSPRDSVVTVVVGGDRDPGFQSCIVPLPGYKAERREEQEFLGISLLPTVGFALVCALHIRTPLHCKPPLNLVNSS